MHANSLKLMEEFRDTLHPAMPLRVLDVGAYDTNGAYRRLFTGPGFNWQYTGVDVRPGPNVDIVLPGPYEWNMSVPYDVVISGQTLEHVENTHAWMREFARLIRPGGRACIIAPYRWGVHRHPVDCWRILPDGMRWLMEEIGGLAVHNVRIERTDCIGIASKPL